MKWLENLNDAVKYIEENLDKEISMEEAARIACCSSCYFQRIFTYITGISPGEYIRRRRMSQAAFELQRTDLKVLDAALKYGYSSPTAFNRAFQSVHGITPAAAKKQGSLLNAYPPVSFSVSISGKKAMPYYIAQKEAMEFAGISIPLKKDMTENQKLIPGFWNQAIQNGFFSQVISLSHKKYGYVFGISVYKSPQEFYYYIAVPSSGPLPQGLCRFQIPASTWVVFENDGRFKEDVQEVFQRFFTEWLPFSGYTYAGLPDIEIYPASSETPTSGHWEVWFGIKKEKEK